MAVLVILSVYIKNDESLPVSDSKHQFNSSVLSKYFISTSSNWPVAFFSLFNGMKWGIFLLAFFSLLRSGNSNCRAFLLAFTKLLDAILLQEPQLQLPKMQHYAALGNQKKVFSIITYYMRLGNQKHLW